MQDCKAFMVQAIEVSSKKFQSKFFHLNSEMVCYK